MLASLVFAPLLLVGAIATPPPGSLDTSFGGDGIVTTALPTNAVANDVALSPGGKLVVVGTVDQRSGDVVVARYNANGTLDRSFGTQGTTTLDLGTDPAQDIASHESGDTLTVAPDSSIQVAYDSYRASILGREGVSGYALFDAIGEPPTTAQSGPGCQGSDDGFLGCGGESRHVIARAPDGSLLIAGIVDQRAGDEEFRRLTIERVGGAGGTATMDFSCCSLAMAVQPDGKIVIAGADVHFTTIISSDVQLLRLTPDLQPDPTFGPGGRRIIDLGAADAATGVAVRADGKIFVSATSSNRPGRLFVLSRNANGTANAAFGANGVASAPLGTRGGAEDITVDHLGRPVVAGTVNDKFTVARFTTGGLPDTTFDGDGKLTRPIGTTSAAHAVVVQNDGRIVLAGQSDGKIALLRLNA